MPVCIPGVVHVEHPHDLDKWEELLGPQSEQLNLSGILYLAQRTGAAELAQREPSLEWVVRALEVAADLSEIEPRGLELLGRV